MATLPDYSINVAQPFMEALKGYQIGMGFEAAKQQNILQQQQAQQALQQQQALQDAQRLVFQNPNAENYARLMTLDPKSSEAYQRAWNARNAQQQETLAADLLRQGAAITSGKPEIAAAYLEDKANAIEAQNNGQPTPESQAARTQARIMKEHPQFALGQIQALLAVNPLGKQASEALAKFGEESRARELQPFKLREQTATTIVKEAEAKFAPEKFGLEIDLTKSQIEQAKAARRAQDAAAAKSGAEAARARAEADQMAAGIIPVEKRPEAEGKFRKEYSDQTKGYQEVKSAYGRVLASEDNAVGDLSLIFGYMKMLDPGSVVREGEFATAQNAAGVPERIQNIYNQVVSGQRLSPSQRQSFKGQAGKLYSTAQTQEAQVRQGIERIAKGYGLNTANIFYTPTEVAPTAPGAAPGAPAPAPGAPVSVTAPNGQVLKFPSQQAADAFKKAAGIR
jgi:hypothetical protein